MASLKKILDHYLRMKDHYGMRSLNRGELANILINSGDSY
jgi:hypothetical protein